MMGGGKVGRKVEAVGYENFSDVASLRFMIFHRTATEAKEK